MTDLGWHHRLCNPRAYAGCYSHWTTPHCRADGMKWPCDVSLLLAERDALLAVEDVMRMHTAIEVRRPAHRGPCVVHDFAEDCVPEEPCDVCAALAALDALRVTP